ncbi:hypothetical protein P6U16_25130 (plasmid) [Rhizobium sp. 32-5/1]|uniref:hypothetical protein n=1 Tax=Rhizobium sp. 32-5/1 TaxID=3019602 RepID=UPI00240DBC4D|nr:hypothetical protein [Rhizobium sp. 32-5/1]WEZ85399.1 hypothetical protein P6U16_25130 [Rhizobium sp. 32-5/1]
MSGSNAVGGTEKPPLEEFKRRFVEHVAIHTRQEVVYGMPVLLYAERIAREYWKTAQHGHTPEAYAQEDIDFWPIEVSS